MRWSIVLFFLMWYFISIVAGLIRIDQVLDGKHQLVYNFTAHLHRVMASHPLPLQSCNKATALAIAKTFKEKGIDNTFCPMDKVFYLMSKSDPMGNKLLIDIGANKGYVIASLITAFVPGVNITGHMWEELVCYGTKPEENCCGACNDCQDMHQWEASLEAYKAFWKQPFKKNTMETRNAHVGTVSVIAADLNQNNLYRISQAVQSSVIQRHLHQRRHHSSANRSHDLRVFTAHGAFSKEEGEISILNCGFGNEQCSMTDSNFDFKKDQSQQQPASSTSEGTNINATDVGKRPRRIQVPMVTLSSLFCAYAKQHLQHTNSYLDECPPVLADIVLIDTEGNDPLVLQGAEMLLQHNRIRCLVFEYHYLKPWSNYRLRDFISQFDAWGYDCYFFGQTALWPLTQGCWHDLFEIKFWSNVICVLRSDIWWNSIQPLVYRPNLN